jgi:MFS transporter, ACDE family, multidrug resistance protein
VVVAPLIGLLADRFGRRELLVPCLAVFGLAGGAAAVAPSFAVLLACRLLQGVGAAGLINLAVVLIGDGWEGADRARVIGQNSAVLTVSIAAIPPLGGALADLGGWRATFVPYWLGLVTAAVVLVVLPRSERRQVRTAEQVRDAWVYLRTPRMVATVATGVVAFVLVFGLFLTTLPLHLRGEFGMGATGRGLILGLPALTSTVAALSLGRLSRRFGARRLVLGASALFAVAFVLIGTAPLIALLALGALVYGVGEGLSFPALQDIAAGAAPATSRGAVVAVWTGGVRAGQTTGPLLASALVAPLGTGGTFVAGAGVAAALLAALVVTGQPADAPREADLLVEVRAG